MTEPGRHALTVEVTTTEDDVDVVVVAGDLDFSSCEHLSAALARLTERPRRVLVDLAGVRFVDSSGVKMLVAAARAVGDAGGELVLANPTRPVRRVFEILHLAQVVPVVDDRSAAFQDATADRTRAEADG